VPHVTPSQLARTAPARARLALSWPQLRRQHEQASAAGTQPAADPRARRAAAALAAARDGDKVRANGVRALGNLLAFVPAAAAGVPPPGGAATRSEGSAPAAAACAETPAAAHAQGPALLPRSEPGARPCDGPPAAEGGQPLGGLPSQVWLAGALRCLSDALATGGVKVQWNACYAAGSLLRNGAAAAAACRLADARPGAGAAAAVTPCGPARGCVSAGGVRRGEGATEAECGAYVQVEGSGAAAAARASAGAAEAAPAARAGQDAGALLHGLLHRLLDVLRNSTNYKARTATDGSRRAACARTCFPGALGAKDAVMQAALGGLTAMRCVAGTSMAHGPCRVAMVPGWADTGCGAPRRRFARTRRPRLQRCRRARSSGRPTRGRWRSLQLR